MNAKTGELLEGEEHWDTLDRVFFRYTRHPESKFANGDQTGTMQRRHIKLNGVVYISKEVPEIEFEYLGAIRQDISMPEKRVT